MTPTFFLLLLIVHSPIPMYSLLAGVEVLVREDPRGRERQRDGGSGYDTVLGRCCRIRKGQKAEMGKSRDEGYIICVPKGDSGLREPQVRVRTRSKQTENK